jgi:hypothetical protein
MYKMDDKSKVYLKSQLTRDIRKKQRRIDMIEKMLHSKSELEREQKQIETELKELQKMLNQVNTNYY